MAEQVWTGRFDREVQNAFARFEERNEDAGVRFHERLCHELARLENFPRLMRVGRAGLRRLSIATTYFCVIYRSEPRGIVLHALIDLRQDPESIERIIREITEGLE